jgi:hypothetical protein
MNEFEVPRNLFGRKQIRTSVRYSGGIAHSVSRRLPTAAARFRVQLRSCGICGGHSGTGAGFLRVLRFPLPILIPPTAPLVQYAN